MQKQLRKILPEDIEGDFPQEIHGLAIDSRTAQKNFLFFAVPGTQVDGHEYIDQAISNGAAVIVHEKEVVEKENILYIKVSSVQNVIGEIASLFFGKPSDELIVVGVTGTNGKTSIATTLHQMATELGLRSGLLSTIENRIGKKVIPATHTTADAVSVQEYMYNMVTAGCTHVFMEVSSHALHQGRVRGVNFNQAIFTNLTQDHLDYHKTLDEYFEAKKIFFDMLTESSFAVVNIDDPYGEKIVSTTKAKVVTYGEGEADYQFKINSMNQNGLEFDINKNHIEVPLVGKFNAYNFTAMYVTLRELGFSHADIESASQKITGVPGRMEVVRSRGVAGIIDYAHTPDAVENVLETLVTLKEGRIITVLGAGGDRDKTKRPRMAAAAEKYSDVLILTSDNPRTEDPLEIIKDMKAGLQDECIVLPDRVAAIQKAAELAKKGDLILLAGKGHENYQIIGKEKNYFSDREELEKALL